MGTLGVIGGGGWRVTFSLFGVVETVVFLEGAGLDGGIGGAAGENGPAEQAEGGAEPSSVEGDAKRHEAFLLVGADGKPHCAHYTTQPWGDTQTFKCSCALK